MAFITHQDLPIDLLEQLRLCHDRLVISENNMTLESRVGYAAVAVREDLVFPDMFTGGTSTIVDNRNDIRCPFSDLIVPI